MRLHARVLGHGPRTFVLLHGLAGSHRYFGATFDELGAEGRLVVPDLLGFGGSFERPSEGYGADAHADAVMRSLEELGAEPPLYLGAHSLGSIVALRMALRWPDRVRGIALFGPPLYRSSEDALASISRLGLWVRLFALETVWARIACAWMCRHRTAAARIAQRLRSELPPEVARDGVLHTWSSYTGSLQSLVLAAGGRQDLERMQIPVRLVVGTEDQVLDRTLLRELAISHAHVALEEWPGGHELPLLDPSRCVSVIQSLIDR